MEVKAQDITAAPGHTGDPTFMQRNPAKEMLAAGRFATDAAKGGRTKPGGASKPSAGPNLPGTGPNNGSPSGGFSPTKL
jgi:hypothetical protein